MKLPSKTLERKLFQNGYHVVLAVDEVGMGSLAGPVVVCAVAFTRSFYKKTHKKLLWLRDSKLLTPRQRERFVAELLRKPNFQYRISFCYPYTVDRLNIYQAARHAMRRAIRRLVMSGQWSVGSNKQKLFTRHSSLDTIVLVDGPTKIKGVQQKQIPVIKGDRKVFAIACASVIAKVFRDRMMVRYAKRYPGYGFEEHKGYGTKYHGARLVALGPCEIHRKSFSPVAKLI